MTKKQQHEQQLQLRLTRKLSCLFIYLFIFFFFASESESCTNSLRAKVNFCRKLHFPSRVRRYPRAKEARVSGKSAQLIGKAQQKYQAKKAGIKCKSGSLSSSFPATDKSWSTSGVRRLPGWCPSKTRSESCIKPYEMPSWSGSFHGNISISQVNKWVQFINRMWIQ